MPLVPLVTDVLVLPTRLFHVRGEDVSFPLAECLWCMFCFCIAGRAGGGAAPSKCSSAHLCFSLPQPPGIVRRKEKTCQDLPGRFYFIPGPSISNVSPYFVRRKEEKCQNLPVRFYFIPEPSVSNVSPYFVGRKEEKCQDLPVRFYFIPEPKR